MLLRLGAEQILLGSLGANQLSCLGRMGQKLPPNPLGWSLERLLRLALEGRHIQAFGQNQSLF